MNEVIGNAAPSNHCPPRSRARFLGGVAGVLAMVAVGCAAPTDATEEEHLSTAEGLSLKDLMGDFGTAMTIAKATNSILEWYGVNLFGPADPSTQDILDQVNLLSGQIDRVDAKVNTLLHDAQTLQLSLQTISNQQIELDVDAQLALMHGNMVNLATYSYELSQGAAPDSGNVAQLSGSTAASVYYFEQPALYQALNGSGTTSWTPLFAVVPFVKAVTLRAVFLGSMFPTTFRNIPGVVDELKSTATFAASLATQTHSWGVQNCAVTTKYVCKTGHYDVEIINTKPVRFFECDVENDSFTASCPGTSFTKSGYDGISAAAAAGQNELTALYPVMDTYLGVDGLNEIASELRTLAGVKKRVFPPIEQSPVLQGRL